MSEEKQYQRAWKNVAMYVDGACVGNPGSGGYAVVLLHDTGAGTKRKEFSGGYSRTTNNRMEVMAAIKGLEALKQHCKVNLYSDSEYVVKAISEDWMEQWESNGWMVKQGKPRLNADLWKRLLDLCRAHDVIAFWVRGHNGDAENERCNVLAETVARARGLPSDPGYEPAASRE